MSNTTGMCGGCSQWMATMGLPQPKLSVLPRSALLSLQGALCGHRLKWALLFMQFPGLCLSGSQVLCRGTDLDGLCILCPAQV